MCHQWFFWILSNAFNKAAQFQTSADAVLYSASRCSASIVVSALHSSGGETRTPMGLSHCLTLMHHPKDGLCWSLMRRSQRSWWPNNCVNDPSQCRIVWFRYFSQHRGKANPWALSVPLYRSCVRDLFWVKNWRLVSKIEYKSKRW
jgi:hypothetical protein